MNCAQRPIRCALPDFAGRLFTIPVDSSAWECLNPASSARDLLLLGIGPGNAATLPFIAKTQEDKGKIYWLEAPELLHAYSQQKDFRQPPENWKKITHDEVSKLATSCRVFMHKAAARLAPDFWLPLRGEAEAAGITRKASRDSHLRAWLPGNDRQLLWPELKSACIELGMEVDAREAEPARNSRNPWPDALPDFILSINFRGLDADGRIFSLAQALDIPVAIWLVDNPWHLLSGIRLPWWQKAKLFLTDPSFADSLKEYGAENITFLPLASAPHMWLPMTSGASGGAPLFVGRSSFPDRERFFSGLKIPPGLEDEALQLLSAQESHPDFHWWQAKLQTLLWPGKAGRLPGFCADACSMRNRANWLEKMPQDMLIIGDEGWKSLLPGRRIEAPTDYYGQLAYRYQASLATLNVTSWLLPGSLNQRHFDVWAAGGLLLGDNISGLQLFPDELTTPMRLNEASEFAEKLAYYKERPQEARDLRAAWREMLWKKHLYRHRIEKILKTLNLAIPENLGYCHNNQRLPDPA